MPRLARPLAVPLALLILGLAACETRTKVPEAHPVAMTASPRLDDFQPTREQAAMINIADWACGIVGIDHADAPVYGEDGWVTARLSAGLFDYHLAYNLYDDTHECAARDITGGFTPLSPQPTEPHPNLTRWADLADQPEVIRIASGDGTIHTANRYRRIFGEWVSIPGKFTGRYDRYDDSLTLETDDLACHGALRFTLHGAAARISCTDGRGFAGSLRMMGGSGMMFGVLGDGGTGGMTLYIPEMRIDRSRVQ